MRSLRSLSLCSVGWLFSWLIYCSILLMALLRKSVGSNTLDTTSKSNNSSTTFYEYNTDILNKIEHNFDLPLQTILGSNMSKNDKINLCSITWAHAVNSRQELEKALNSNVYMIEADIVLGKLNGIGLDLPVMAHPPANTSDISLKSFLLKIMTHNSQEQTIQTKGIKLDFKSIEVFEGSLDILKELVPKMISYPIWLNADIIGGPVDQTDTVPVDPARFLVSAAQFENAVLSIGWTTRWGSEFRDGTYTNLQLNEMQQAIETNNVSQPITFPVRAGIAANSREQLLELLSFNGANAATLTIWSAQNDYVDIDKLRQLIYAVGVDRVYLDVPPEISEQLELDRDAGNATAMCKTLIGYGAISMSLLVAFWLIRRTRL